MSRLTSPRVVRDLLADRGIRLSAKLGQHFLCDEHAVARIASQVGPEEVVLEIGCGLGTLTQALARRARRVIGLELDPRLFPLLREQLAGAPHVELHRADALKVDWAAWAPSGGKLVVVGNLPYQITSPLLDKLVRSRAEVARGVLMVQRELADKVLAPVGSGRGSALGVRLQAFARVERLFEVSRQVFFPRPQVDATVFSCVFLEKPRFQAEEAIFFRVVRAAFHLRRKTVKQALIRSPFLGLAPAVAQAALEAAGVDPRRRGETLSLEEFDRLALQLTSTLRTS